MNNRNKDEQKLPMFTPKNPDGTQRVIKQIMVIDPNKLRVAGLDLKMAAALSKAKERVAINSPVIISKDDKLTLAKNILNKKLRHAQMLKETTKQTSLSQHSSAKSVEDTTRKVSFAKATKVSLEKPQIKVAALKSLMPPPSTVVLNFQKFDEKTGTMEVNLQNSSSGHHKRIDAYQIPKASIKRSIGMVENQHEIDQTTESELKSTETKLEVKNKVIESKVEPPHVSKNPMIKYMPLDSKNDLPKVIESKVLSPEEKIDLSTLRVTSTARGVDLRKYTKVKEKKISDLVSSKPIIKESAVDFINNFFEIKSKDECKPKAVFKKETKPIEEDATSFLMSIFGQQGKTLDSKMAAVEAIAKVHSSETEKVPQSETVRPEKPEILSQTTIRPEPIKMPVDKKAMDIAKVSTEIAGGNMPIANDLSKKHHPANIEIKARTEQIAVSYASIHVAPISSPNLIESVSTLQKDENTQKVEPSLRAVAVELSLLDQERKEKKESLQVEKISQNTAEKVPTKSELKMESESSHSPPPANTRRKGRKSVPVLIAKLNRNLKPALLSEQPSDKVKEIIKVSKSVEEITPPPRFSAKEGETHLTKESPSKIPNQGPVKLSSESQKPDETVETNSEKPLPRKPLPNFKETFTDNNLNAKHSTKPIFLENIASTDTLNFILSEGQESAILEEILPDTPLSDNSIEVTEKKYTEEVSSPKQVDIASISGIATRKTTKRKQNLSLENITQSMDITFSTPKNEDVQSNVTGKDQKVEKDKSKTRPKGKTRRSTTPTDSQITTTSHVSVASENKDKLKIIPQSDDQLSMISSTSTPNKSCRIRRKSGTCITPKSMSSPEVTAESKSCVLQFADQPTSAIEISNQEKETIANSSTKISDRETVKTAETCPSRCISGKTTVELVPNAEENDKRTEQVAATVSDLNKTLPESSNKILPPSIIDDGTCEEPGKEEPKARTIRIRKKTAKFEEYSKSSKNPSAQSSTTNEDSETTEELLVDTESPISSTSLKSTTRLCKGKINLLDDKKETSSTELDPNSSFELLKMGKVEEHMTASLPECNSPEISDDCNRFDECSSPVIGIRQETTNTTLDEIASEDVLSAFRTVKSIKNKENNADEENVEERSKSVCEIDDFLGFNEQEIEEGHLSTSFRLSQSEDVVPHQLTSPPTGIKKKRLPLPGGKKPKIDEQKWKKSSAASLKNWLTGPDKSIETEPENMKMQIGNEEINLSIPLKKRRNRKIVELNEDAKPTSDNLDEVKNTSISVKNKGEQQSIIKEDTAEALKQGRSCVGSECSDPVVDKTTTPSKTPKIKPKAKSVENETVKMDRDKEESSKANSISAKNIPSKALEKKNNSNIEADAKPPPKSTDTLRTPRKRKNPAVVETTPTLEPPSKIPHLSEDNDSIFTIPPPRRRGRPSRVQTIAKLEAAKSPKSSYTPAPPVSPLEKKYKNDSEFNPRLLLIRKKEEFKADTPLIDPDLQTVPKNQNDVQCALCLGYTAKKNWIQHVSEHYGIGWIVGTPPTVNLKSRASVLNFMVEFFKISKVKGLNCRICNAQRRSALGLLVHLEQCWMTEDELKETRVQCEHCKVDYSRTTIVTHLRACPALILKEQSKQEETAETDPVNAERVLSNTGRFKRKSVIKAENKFKSLNDIEFIPDELIKHIPQPRTDTSTWLREIQSFGKGFCVQKRCPFTATTVEELLHHCQEDECSYIEKSGYVCLKCRFRGDRIETVRTHVLATHQPKLHIDFEDSGDEAVVESASSSESLTSADINENSSNENANEAHPPKRKRNRVKNRAKTKKNIPTKDFKKLLPDRDHNIATLVGNWYKKFVKTNYSESPLFTYATPCVIQTADFDSFESCFPKSPISMKFALNGFDGFDNKFVNEFGKTQMDPDQWQRLERLKTINTSSEHITYLGGSVKSIAWAPIEPHPPSTSQYLVIATKKGIDKFTRFLKPKISRSLIYVYKYHMYDASKFCGDIHYAFAIDGGPVHCIEFLPSGGYAPEMNRLGLLAVATVESDIKIYSLPLEVKKEDCDIFPIVQLEASAVLYLELAESPNEYSEQYHSQCMSLVWSQSAGHSFIIGGYLNGYVAIWDISDEEDNLNRFLVNRTRKFVPASYFWTTDNRINQIAAHYDVNGLRWLAVSNSTRKFLLYDLREISKPVLFYMDTTKNNCNSLDWPVVWENPSYGLGDTMPSQGNCIHTMSPMSLGYVGRRFDKFCSAVNDIHFNVWRNLYAGGSDNGDIHVIPLREAILDVGVRSKIDEKSITTLDIVPLEDDVVGKKRLLKLSDRGRLFDSNDKEKYGVVFGSIQKVVGSTIPALYDTKRIPPLNLTRLMRVNRVRFNPNRNANALLAVGYDNGFLRVIQSDWHKSLKDNEG